MMKLLWPILAFYCCVSDADTKPDFGQLNQLAGHCWQAEFSDGKRVDTHCFSEVYDGAFIKDEHVVCGGQKPYYGETWYAFNKSSSSVSYRYFNSLGGVSDGEVSFAENTLYFPEEHYKKDNQTLVYKTTWTLADGQYTSEMLQLDQTLDSGWKPVWKMQFNKVKLSEQTVVTRDQDSALRCQ